MSTVSLRNINPLGYVDLTLIRREGASDDENGDKPGVGCLVPGEVFEVSSEIAGKAPHWRPATKDDAEAIRRGHVETRPVGDPDESGDQAVEVLDPGHGLLAQTGNYELVTKKKG